MAEFAFQRCSPEARPITAARTDHVAAARSTVPDPRGTEG
jgi:hypothetical protein